MMYFISKNSNKSILHSLALLRLLKQKLNQKMSEKRTTFSNYYAHHLELVYFALLSLFFHTDMFYKEIISLCSLCSAVNNFQLYASAVEYASWKYSYYNTVYVQVFCKCMYR